MTDLEALLGQMAPSLRPGDYVFCTLPPDATIPDGLSPFATVREDEALTLVIERDRAAGLACSDDAFRIITLEVHSSLIAVGFIAVVTRILADAGIPANVFAGFHHDHVAVPAKRAAEALNLLRNASASPRR